jgi:hypothetical protein
MKLKTEKYFEQDKIAVFSEVGVLLLCLTDKNSMKLSLNTKKTIGFF